MADGVKRIVDTVKVTVEKGSTRALDRVVEGPVEYDEYSGRAGAAVIRGILDRVLSEPDLSDGSLPPALERFLGEHNMGVNLTARAKVRGAIIQDNKPDVFSDGRPWMSHTAATRAALCVNYAAGFALTAKLAPGSEMDPDYVRRIRDAMAEGIVVKDVTGALAVTKAKVVAGGK
jgi:hypothetical protein